MPAKKIPIGQKRIQRGFTISPKTSDLISQIAIVNDIAMNRVIDLVVREYAVRHGIKANGEFTESTLSPEQLASIKARNALRHKKLAKGRKTAM